MDKLSKRLLKLMSSGKYPAGTSFSCSSNFDGHSNVSLRTLCASTGNSEQEVIAALKYLVESGYAEPCHMSTRSGKIVVGVRLKHEGLRYREFSFMHTRDNVIHFLLGLFSGILISVISAYITSRAGI